MHLWHKYQAITIQFMHYHTPLSVGSHTFVTPEKMSLSLLSYREWTITII